MRVVSVHSVKHDKFALRLVPGCFLINIFASGLLSVKLLIVERAVLPIENAVDGSTHRNYDLLQSHRPYIVGKLQLAVHHCRT